MEIPQHIDTMGPQTCRTHVLEGMQEEQPGPGHPRGSLRGLAAWGLSGPLGMAPPRGSVFNPKHFNPMPPAHQHQGSGPLASPTAPLFSSTDVVNLDLKSTLRVLYNLFTKYKNLE